MTKYTNDMKHKGFTVVELLVVIVVVVLLATITIVAYSFMREDAMDAKIRATTKTAGDALALYESQNGAKLAVGGYFSNSGGTDSLVPMYLPQGYRDGITSKNTTHTNHVFRWYTCNDGSRSIVVYASLNNPSADDLATFENIRTSCAHTTVAPNTGTPRYNYAQIF
ncbi:hypothetical protein B7Y94_04400 [Candidatus Saccharibacteria bacterium 32-49-12]|nr:MAG: hypothetical protein B7Y94_04400 [Candidatus Saccharibacteria bacterium 32-49-12]